MSSSRAIFSENAYRRADRRVWLKFFYPTALLSTAALFALTGNGLAGSASRLHLAQTQQLRGLSDDPRSYLPSVRGTLRRQQDKQIGTFSRRQAIEQSERRQTLERMNDKARNCPSASGTDCTPLQPK